MYRRTTKVEDDATYCLRGEVQRFPLLCPYLKRGYSTADSTQAHHKPARKAPGGSCSVEETVEETA